jgi:hypothetical protein
MPSQDTHTTPSHAETAEIMHGAIIQLREMYVYSMLRLPPYDFSPVELSLADKMISNLDAHMGSRDALGKIASALYYMRPSLHSAQAVTCD